MELLSFIPVLSILHVHFTALSTIQVPSAPKPDFLSTIVLYRTGFILWGSLLNSRIFTLLYYSNAHYFPVAFRIVALNLFEPQVTALSLPFLVHTQGTQ
jgi:hypothetical protein